MFWELGCMLELFWHLYLMGTSAVYIPNDWYFATSLPEFFAIHYYRKQIFYLDSQKENKPPGEMKYFEQSHFCYIQRVIIVYHTNFILAISTVLFVRHTKTTHLYFLGFSWVFLDKVSLLAIIDAGIVNKN